MVWTTIIGRRPFGAAIRHSSGLALGRWCVAGTAVLVLVGCAVPAPRTAPPVPMRPPVAAAVTVPEPAPPPIAVIQLEQAPDLQPEPLTQPAPTPAAPPAPMAPAALTLAAQSDAALAGGDLLRAEQHLERALRIAPRDPELWHRMARVRLAQADYLQAERMANRSLQLSVGDRRLAAANWRLIAQARLALGDAAGAARAREEADRLESIIG